MTFCEIILVGNVGKDPELRFTNTGSAVCDFSLAVNRNRRQGEEWIKETTWFRITVWGQQAESVKQYVQKGKQVLVIGDRIEANAFVGKDGQARASLDVTARTVRFLSGREEGSSGERGEYYSDNFEAPSDVDDIPF